jgi:hypothetical protein
MASARTRRRRRAPRPGPIGGRISRARAIDRPGPPLLVPQENLAASLKCPGDLAGAQRDPVLLLPGTTLNPKVRYSWNWERAIAQRGMPYCTVGAPRQRDGRHPGRRRVRRARNPRDARGRRPPGRHRRPLPGRDGAAVGTALLARHPGDGRRPRGAVAEQPRAPSTRTRSACRGARRRSGSSAAARTSSGR